MIISKSNIIRENTITLNTGTISSGALVNIQNPNFSRVVSSNSSTFKFTLSSVGQCRYVALHGINFPIGAVVTVTGSGGGSSFNKSYTMVRDIKNLVFYVEVGVTLNSLAVQIAGAGSKTISYMSAGSVTEIDWGTNAGQDLYYLVNNKKNRTATTSRGLPTERVQEEVAPRLKLTIKDATKAWARTDLREVFDHYDSEGIVSLIDYEEEYKPEESYALFELSSPKVSTHSQAPILVDVSLSFKVVA